MSRDRREVAIAGLRWTVGLIVMLQSAKLVLSASVNRHFASMGMPLWVRPALALVEFAAAVLFLLPSTRKAGGYSLLFVFVFAALVHILHGEYDIAPLAVYAMAVITGMTYGEQTAAMAK